MDEWERAWLAETGAAAEEATEPGLDVRNGTDGSAAGDRGERGAVSAVPSPPASPVEGQVWLDAINPPNFEWVVAAVEGELVTLQMLRDGELTQSVLVWPLNRWPALVEKQRLSLKAAA